MDRDDDAALAATVGAPKPNATEMAETVTAEPVAVAQRTAAPTMELAKGQELGRYLILEELGRGGMGIVYAAYDPDLNRKVALKVLHASTDPEARARLLREAQAMAKLAHPNVVTVYEVGSEGKRDYVAMEFVDGCHLGQWAKDEHTVEEILDVYRQAGQGLAAAHRAGLVHRDFKPYNALIDQEGRVRVTDFGLALSAAAPDFSETVIRNRRRGAADDSASLTQTGAIMGTPGYMAPEQHLAAPADQRSDQFSFCVALFEALTKERPFAGGSYQELKERVTQTTAKPLPSSVNVPSQVRQALAKGMARYPEDRHESMEALLRFLTLRKRRKSPWVLAVAILLLVPVSIFALRSTNPANSCRPDPSIVAHAWSEDIQGELSQAFANTGVADAKAVYDRFTKVTQTYADDLVEMRLDICKANRARTQSDNLIVLRMGCLQRRIQELSAVTTAFAKVDENGVDRSIEAALNLPPVADCANVERLEQGVAGPSPTQREKVQEIRGKLSEAIAMGEAGNLLDAIAQAESLKSSATATGYAPLRTEAFTTLGKLYARALRIKEAEAAFTEAIVAAEESGHDEYRARALVGLTRTVALGSSRFADARRFARQAQAAVERWDKDPALSVEIDLAMAHILTQEEKYSSALQLLMGSLEHYQTKKEQSPVTVGELLEDIAHIESILGMHQDAFDHVGRAYDLLREHLGDEHPRTLQVIAMHALAFQRLERFDEAHDLTVRLRRFWQGTKGLKLLAKEGRPPKKEKRTLRGNVVDAKEVPVGGATVVCAENLVADGRHLDATPFPKTNARNRERVVQTTEDGAFACKGASADALVVVADHTSRGRSKATQLPAGSEEVTNLRLVVEKTASVTGSIPPKKRAEDGSAPPIRKVIAIPAEGNTNYAATVLVRPDGTFRFERLAPGQYQFMEQTGVGLNYSITAEAREIAPGSQNQVHFSAASGTGRVKLSLRGKDNANIPSAQVLVVKGDVPAKLTIQELNETFSRRFPHTQSRIANTWPQTIGELKEGSYAICAAPLAGDFRDVEYMRQLTPEVMNPMLVYCQDIELAEGQTREVTLTVPPATPIIELPKSEGNETSTDQ